MKNKILQEYIEKLNSEQKKAATLELNKSSLILSVAGSGKTSTLIARVAYLIENNVLPENILAVTFTNKAANEMKQRLKLLGIERTPAWMGTFHSICNKIIRYHYEKIGLKNNYHIIDTQEQESLIKKIIKTDYPEFDSKEVLFKINSWQEKGFRASQIQEPSIMAQIFDKYEQSCLTNNCIDFGQLISRVCEIFDKYPDILSKYHKTFKYILIDEFQDTNTLQYKWLKDIAGINNKNNSITNFFDNEDKTSCVFAVGDDDQSLYSWRGAEVENMNLFINDFSPEIIKLEKNYRSQANILEAANNVIANNKKRQIKTLVPTIKSDSNIKFYKAFNDMSEAGFIAEQINKLRREGIKYSQIAILYRKNAQSRTLEKVFSSQNIPFIIYGGFRFFDRAEIKSAIAYLRLAYNKHDNLAFSRVYNFPTRGIGSTSFEKIFQISNEKKISLYDSIDYLDKKVKDKFLDFKILIDSLNEKLNTLINISLYKTVTQIIIDSGLENLYKQDKQEGMVKLDNLYELISAAKVFEVENSNLDKDKLLNEFFALSSLESDVQTDKKNEQTDAIKMMTIHTSKGLEWNTVFICGLDEGILPHVSNIEENDLLEEERRLFYVAITRAKKNLYITRAEERMIAGNFNYMSSSRFLHEIPKHLFERAG